jgi:hypothetical protein
MYFRSITPFSDGVPTARMTLSAPSSARAISVVARKFPAPCTSARSSGRPALVDRGLGPVQPLDDGGVEIDAGDVMALGREAHARDEADISGSDDREFHAPASISSLRNSRYRFTPSSTRIVGA